MFGIRVNVRSCERSKPSDCQEGRGGHGSDLNQASTSFLA